MTRSPQLKSGVWIDALIRRAQVAGAFACVVQSGDRDAGSVLVAVCGRDALRLYTPERDMDGARVWRSEALDEAALSERVRARLDFDPDLSLVEIEDRDGRSFILEPVLDDPVTIELATTEAPASEAPVDGAAAAAAARALFRDR